MARQVKKSFHNDGKRYGVKRALEHCYDNNDNLDNKGEKSNETV